MGGAKNGLKRLKYEPNGNQIDSRRNNGSEREKKVRRNDRSDRGTTRSGKIFRSKKGSRLDRRLFSHLQKSCRCGYIT